MSDTKERWDMSLKSHNFDLTISDDCLHTFDKADSGGYGGYGQLLGHSFTKAQATFILTLCEEFIKSEREACIQAITDVATNHQCANCGGQNPHDICDTPSVNDYVEAIRKRGENTPS